MARSYRFADLRSRGATLAARAFGPLQSNPGKPRLPGFDASCLYDTCGGATCQESCVGTCSLDSCSDTCPGSCFDTCHSSCDDTCQGSCGLTCGSSCDETCNRSCGATNASDQSTVENPAAGWLRPEISGRNRWG